MTQEYEYDAFGNEQSPSANDTNPLRYCGEYFDAETGTIYLRARYYDPSIGRFTSADTVLQIMVELSSGIEVPDPLSLNRYTYCHNNPVMYVDQNGKEALIVIGGITITLGQAIAIGAVAVTAAGLMMSPSAREAISDATQRAQIESLYLMTELAHQTFEFSISVVDGMMEIYNGVSTWFINTTDEIGAWSSQTLDDYITFFKEHTKLNGSKSRTNDKHTKPRPGRDSEKKKQNKNWKGNPNKRP